MELQDLIVKLKQKPFATLNIDQKNEILSGKRPTPDLPLLKSICASKRQTFKRKFNIKSYEETKWLAGSAELNKLFCWPCLLFFKDAEKSVWNTTGFSDLNHLSSAISKHEKAKTHIKNCLAFKTFGTIKVDLTMDEDEQSNISILNHNERVRKNRIILKILINVVMFFGKQELSFRGHDDDSTNSANRGNYIELLNFLAEYHEPLAHHLSNSKIFGATSAGIQNDLILSISEVVKESIVHELKTTKFITIMLDETTDSSGKSQLFVIFRYLLNGTITERFYTFFDVGRTAEAISEYVINLILALNCENKIIGQGYGVAAVLSGKSGGVQSIVRKRFPSCKYIHCCAHVLNLALSKSLEFIKPIKIFFTTLSSIATFFLHSAKRTNALDEIVQKRIPAQSSMRWNFTTRLVNTVSNHKEDLQNLFEKIIDSPDDWDENTTLAARGFTNFFEQFETIFFLKVFAKIFVFTDQLLSIMLSQGFDINSCVSEVENINQNIIALRACYAEIYQDAVSELGPPKKKRNTDSNKHFKQIYYEIIDTIETQISDRIESLNELKFMELLNSSKFQIYQKTFPKILLEELRNCYEYISFNYIKLENELAVLYASYIFINKNLLEIEKIILSHGMCSEFSEVHKLLNLILTLPSTTAETERLFSILKRIKTYSRSMLTEERLAGLALLAIEKEYVAKMHSEDSFFDKIIDNFAEKGRRAEFIFKT